jgi:hypothetical protein
MLQVEVQVEILEYGMAAKAVILEVRAAADQAIITLVGLEEQEQQAKETQAATAQRITGAHMHLEQVAVLAQLVVTPLVLLQEMVVREMFLR